MGRTFTVNETNTPNLPSYFTIRFSEYWRTKAKGAADTPKRSLTLRIGVVLKFITDEQMMMKIITIKWGTAVGR